MDDWIEVRLAARACHAAALAEAGHDRRARALVAAFARLHDLEIHDVAPGTRFSEDVQGCFDRVGLLVNLSDALDPEERDFVAAHEFGHFRLHDDPLSEVRATPAALGGDVDGPVSIAAAGYSPRERKEVQADVFAAEFLCPADWLRSELVASRRRPSDVAVDLGVPARLVVAQAIRALLLSPLRTPRSREAAVERAPDPSQVAATTWSGGPLLVEAGPGTGKTRTLVERILHLVAGGVQPSEVLALTFSNLAAAEMRMRIAAKVEGAAGMWIGTFHSFGLEILSQRHADVGLPADFAILDGPACLELLESNLGLLPLRHYQNLHEPAYELITVLRIISRFKDEMMTPAAYRAAADAALAIASEDDPEEVERAERAVELAAIYATYEHLLRERHAVDFGDLVAMPAALLERDAALAGVMRARYPCILVDEFQDVNVAGARLLKALHRPEGMLWVVGDQKQSVYRFRGAEPANVVRFRDDFGGRTATLDWNYRSGAPVVRVLERFVERRRLPGQTNWHADRGAVGSVGATRAATVAGEAASIAERVRAFERAGVPLGEQAILARSHLALERVTRELERHGVPLLYLGDLFERPEVRDLLSLVAIDAERGGVGLLRVAQLPEYAVPRPCALAVLAEVRDSGRAVSEVLGDLESVRDLGTEGRVGLARLSRHLEGMGENTSAWTLLTTWLLERSDYLRPLVEADDAASRQKLVAIYHLLKACAPPLPPSRSSRRAFLARIRRVEALDQDKEFRRIASEASHGDAVRVLTVHASKGLEFGAVHLPVVATRYAPSSWRGALFKPVEPYARLAMDKAGHEAEERCLFFVAMSRARDHLSFSRAERYTTTKAGRSEFLADLDGLVSERTFPEPAARHRPEAEIPVPHREVHEARDLELYDRCPAAYRHEVLDGVERATDPSAYLRFHACVYATLEGLEGAMAAGLEPTPEAASSLLAGIWEARGPTTHGFADYYRSVAEAMVRGVVDVMRRDVATRYLREEWVVDLGAGRRVSVLPDRVFEDAYGSVVVQRVRTGKRTKSEAAKPIYSLLSLGVEQRHPGRRTKVETLYLADGMAVAAGVGDRTKALDTYRDAIAGIEAGRFAPKPVARTCASCRSYFVCGA